MLATKKEINTYIAEYIKSRKPRKLSEDDKYNYQPECQEDPKEYDAFTSHDYFGGGNV